MAREAEFDEPLPVDGLGHLLQYLDAPEIIFNEVIVGGKDTGNSMLNVDFGIPNYALECGFYWVSLGFGAMGSESLSTAMA